MEAAVTVLPPESLARATISMELTKGTRCARNSTLARIPLSLTGRGQGWGEELGEMISSRSNKRQIELDIVLKLVTQCSLDPQPFPQRCEASLREDGARAVKSHHSFQTLRRVFAGMISVCACVGPASAERIDNQVAIFSALDKVTARISKFEVELGKTASFGALRVTPRTCYSRPTTEEPKTTTFVEVDEVQQDGKQKRIFTGWMFAESPGLYGVEHPTFDVWLTHCEKPLRAAAQKAAEPAAGGPSGAGAAKPASGNAAKAAPDTEAASPPDDIPEEPRRRVRR